MLYEENKSLFFKVTKNSQIFPVCHFQYDHRFLFSREMQNIRRYKEIRLQNLLNLDCQNSIRFGIVKLLINDQSFRKNFAFQQNVLTETLKVCFKNLNFLSCTLLFLNTMTFRRFIIH